MTHLILPALFLAVGLIVGLYLLRCRHIFRGASLENGDRLESCQSCGHMKKIVRAS